MNGLTKEYTTLFNGITDFINLLEAMVEDLRQLQQVSEDAYLETKEAS